MNYISVISFIFCGTLNNNELKRIARIDINNRRLSGLTDFDFANEGRNPLNLN